MKTLLAGLVLLLSLSLRAEKITVPAELKLQTEITFDLPTQTNATSIIIVTNITVINTNVFNIVTNVFTTISITTNITVVGGATGTPKIVVLNDNVINPDLGTRLQRNFSVPATFSFGSFATNSYTTFYWRNPNRQRITWPSGIVWLNGLPPTNQVRGAVLFEHISSEGTIWATQ